MEKGHGLTHLLAKEHKTVQDYKQKNNYTLIVWGHTVSNEAAADSPHAGRQHGSVQVSV